LRHVQGGHGIHTTAEGIATTLPELAAELALAPVQENGEFAAVEEEIADQFFPCLAFHLLGHDTEAARSPS
jgi:hypothetical protein